MSTATATGIHHRTYRAELRLRHTRAEYVRLALMIVLLLAAPYILDRYWLGIANTILIAVIGAVGLNILVGFTGQISLGQGGFLAVGAYTSAILSERAGLPAPISITIAVLLTAAVGAFFGLPALRLKGLYLAIATLASQEIIMFVVRRWEFLTEGKGFIEVSRLEIFGWTIKRQTFEVQWYWLLLAITIAVVVVARNLFRTGLGRSFMAVRDQDIAAQAIGVNITRAKVTAFAVSSGFVGLAGALTAHYTETVTWERFTLDVSVLYLAMIIVGGLGSIAGAVYGAIFMGLLPALLTELVELASATVPSLTEQLPAIRNAVFGIAIIVFLLVEPRGLDRIWSRIKDYIRFWPFRY
ncbi:branched-chain amino acid ABC transporter permease [Intrasporangium sp.]|uniref:branched-chain amino acid ABC transporter permease n=1 Tax=Intrasporangium sp. TaxID=1925024 RepID=UPI00336585E4